MIFQFRDQFYTLAPPWLQTGNAERYMYTMQLCSDLLMEKMNEAIMFRLPGQGDASQLPYLAYDRQLQQGPLEPNAAFVARLKNAFEAWGLAGSRVAVLQQLQAYLQGLQPGVAGTLPQMAIVGGYYSTVTTWDTLTQGAALGSTPSKMTVQPANWNWDGKSQAWRTWLILYMSLVGQGIGGSAATITSAAAGSFASPGQNVNGVWVPATSGTPVNSPWITLSGMSGLTSTAVGQWLQVTGSSHAANNGFFQIAQVLSLTSCVIANPAGVAPDTGPLTWSLLAYPFMAPGAAWGTPGYVFGQGELTTPTVDTGSNVGGVWQPTQLGTSGTLSWGLSVSSQTIASIRGIVKTWKSAATWYKDIIISFDPTATDVPGGAYSPSSTPGSGNPDGTFGGHGKNVNGVWVPTRQIGSSADCFCQGTGSWVSCSVPNVT